MKLGSIVHTPDGREGTLVSLGRCRAAVLSGEHGRFYVDRRKLIKGRAGRLGENNKADKVRHHLRSVFQEVYGRDPTLAELRIYTGVE